MTAHHRSLSVASVVKNMTSIHEVVGTYCISFPYSPMHGCHRSGNGQGKKKILQGQGNVREFYYGSGKIGIFKKSQGKLKL